MENIQVSDSLRKFAERNTPDLLFGESAMCGLGGKNRHVKNVVRLGMKLPMSSLNPELVQIALQLHDIGRSVQWAISKNFSDREINHRYNALQMVENFIRGEKCDISYDWIVVTEVMQYHGVSHMYPFAHDFALPYIQLVSLADDIENGCNGALGYLEDEKERDDKGYIHDDPKRDQKDLNPELLGYLERGEKFNKMTLCHTYAEYFVFAAMLAVNACNNAGEIAKEAMKDKCYCYEDNDGTHWLDAVDGYCYIFNKHLHSNDAERACTIMREKCR